MVRKTLHQLEIAGILPGGDYHKEGSMIIRKLLKETRSNDPSIPSETYYRLVGNKIGEVLLDANVFTRHVRSGRIKFHSILTLQTCKERSGFWYNKWFTRWCDWVDLGLPSRWTELAKGWGEIIKATNPFWTTALRSTDEQIETKSRTLHPPSPVDLMGIGLRHCEIMTVE